MGFDEGRFWVLPALGWLGVLGMVAGCASPGTPRAPSLQLPDAVQNLTVTRVGDAVEVRFTVPTRTTDGVALRGATVSGVLCRQEDKAGPCRTADGEETAGPLALGKAVVWRDVLPASLAAGPARAVAYRVELRNARGRSAGYSEAVYGAAGRTPPAVEGFAAEGVRSGVLLTWRAASGTAALSVRRERVDGISPGQGGPGTQGIALGGRRKAGSGQSTRGDSHEDDAAVWLKAAAGGQGVPEMVDGTVEEGARYRYTAVRSETVRVGGRTLEVRSAPSAGVEMVWRDVYPPAAPQGLTALGYAAGSEPGGASSYAVDLIWEPVSDPRVTGYVVVRQKLDAAGQAVGAVDRLSAEPVSTPGFHDASAKAGERYRYRVTAVDAKGNASSPAVADTH